MISNIIYNSLVSKFPTKLKPTSDFFLEKAVGNKFVLIKTIGSNRPVKSIDKMKFTKIYIVISGWKMSDAMMFANEMEKYINEIRGEHVLNGLTYDVKETVTNPLPIPVDSTRNDASQVIYFGVGIFYAEI